MRRSGDGGGDGVAALGRRGKLARIQLRLLSPSCGPGDDIGARGC